MNNPIFRIFQPLFLTLLLAGIGWMPTHAQNRPTPNAQLASKQLNARVEALLKKMTLDEKIGQLVQNSATYAAGPGASNARDDEIVAKGQIGAMLLVGAEGTNHYQHIAMEKSRLHIPLIFATEVLHGYRTTFPVPLPLAAIWNARRPLCQLICEKLVLLWCFFSTDTKDAGHSKRIRQSNAPCSRSAFSVALEL